MIRFYFILLFCFITNIFFSQEGDYFIANYEKANYNGASQNFDIIQDDFGLLYFANNAAILKYDGKSWEHILLTDAGKTPLCFGKTKDGKIYVGGENEVGYLTKDSKNKTIYKSLTNLLNKKNSYFTRVWYIIIINDDVYFCANEIIIRYRNGKVKTWKPKDAFHKAHIIDNKLFVREVGKGLMYLNNKDEFEMIEGSDFLSEADFKIAFFTKGISVNEYLLFTRKHGVYKFILNSSQLNKSYFKKIEPKYFKELDNVESFDGLVTRKGNIIIATKDAGLFEYDSDLMFNRVINTQSGLLYKSCNKLFIDNQSNLWCALDNGLSKIEINSPLTKLGKNSNIDVAVETYTRYKGQSYIGTYEGLMKYDITSNKYFYVSEFNKTRCYDLKVIDNLLYIATDNGLFVYDSEKFINLYNENIVYKIEISQFSPDNIFCATDNGILLIDKRTNTFLYEIVSPLNSEVKSVSFVNKNILIASTRSEGIFYYDFTSSKVYILPSNVYYSKASENYLFSYKGKCLIASDSGIYYIDDNLLFNDFLDINHYIKGKYSISKAQICDRILLLSYSKVGGKNSGEEGNFAIFLTQIKERNFNNNILSRIGELSVRSFIEDKNRIYMPTDDGLYVYNFTKTLIHGPPSVYISHVICEGDTIQSNIVRSTVLPEISYKRNSILINFGTNDYSVENKLYFQFYLEGRENKFNEWTPAYNVSYDNLFEGEYIFHLRAKNIYGQISEEFSLKLFVLPPWYRTTFAYVLYTLLLIMIFFLAIFLNSKRLVAKNKKLEETIIDRTKEISEQKVEIEKKNKEITDSINYAQKIQLALMASIKILDRNLKNDEKDSLYLSNDYFLLYKPKDIVSGDFYWAAELTKNNQTEFIIVIADCTGHGVPGAFMSLLCIGFLNEIIKEKEITDPGQVFNELRSRIITTLNPEGTVTEQKDGMDAIILNVNKNTGSVSYAAANNSFYLVRNQNLIELKADKMPVGIYSGLEQSSFNTNYIEVERGDKLYLFTDGYADQFGGPKGKKFKYKQLEHLLIDNSGRSMTDQFDILNRNFDKWKGDLEQVDDLLLMGISF